MADTVVHELATATARDISESAQHGTELLQQRIAVQTAISLSKPSSAAGARETWEGAAVRCTHEPSMPRCYGCHTILSTRRTATTLVGFSCIESCSRANSTTNVQTPLLYVSVACLAR